MYGLDLFSGIGGITKALEGYVEPIAYCEINSYCQAVLLSRMAEGDLPLAPIWDDVKTLTSHEIPPVDCIYGGFPCQDISIAGRGRGLESERSGLFFEIIRLAREIRPKFIFLENVAEIINRGGVRVIGELASIGYDVRWITISASFIGAFHKRQRWFALAYATNKRCQRTIDGPCTQIKKWPKPESCTASRNPPIDERGFIKEICTSEFVRTPNGLPHRMDRIIALGNAVYPAQARYAFEMLMGLK